ncbi:MAG: PilZ domain-containing protein [Treponemataceae bacterium]|nr:PilZ domain-containing protein [Treponemataceae bacterium]
MKKKFSTKVKFYTTGFDSGFSFRQMRLVWKLGNIADVADATVLFWSLPSINKAIATVVSKATSTGSIHLPKTKDFLDQLYAYRSKIELDPPLKAGIKNTSFLRVGQKLRIVLPQYGIFSANVLKNEGFLTISYPKPIKNQYRCFEWVKKTVTVYFWRKNDAGYMFDTRVGGAGHYQGMPVLFLEHSTNLQRSQKRKSIRCPCSINADLYLLSDVKVRSPRSPETEKGIKCLIEDLSEDGALIRIGGKGHNGMGIKIQFMLGTSQIVMSGTVKSIEYNETINQSRLHFQCDVVDDNMRQIISMYVYSVIPEEQKQAFDAISLIENDEEGGSDDDDVAELEEV